MAKQSRDAAVIKEMRGISATLALHGSEVPQLASAHTALDGVLNQLDELIAQRSFHRSNKQKATEKYRQLLDEGAKIATVIKVTLKQHFGNRSEDLVKFGLQPFRGRTRTTATPAPENPPAPAPEEPTATPPVTPASPSTV